MSRPLPAPFDKAKVVAENRRARFDYAIDEVFEAGIALTGTEVKSLRAGRADLARAFADVRDGEVWLVGAHIDEYARRYYQYKETYLEMHKEKE